MKLNDKEEKEFQNLIKTNSMYKEVEMLQSIEEVGIEKGIEKGRIKTLEKMTMNLLKSKLLTPEQIMQVTGLNIAGINEINQKIGS